MREPEVRKLRLGLGLSQERFARLLSVSLQTVRRWEEGISRPLPIIALKLEELEQQLREAQLGKGGVTEMKAERKPGEVIELSLGGLFKGLGGLFDLVSQLAEEGKESYSTTGEVSALGGKAKGVYGLSLRVGLGGKPIIEQFGNIRATKEGVEVAEVREPLVDILDEGSRLVVIAELPGVAAEDISLEVKGDILELRAESRARKYSKEVLLPAPVDASTLESAYNNGILEIKLAKKTSHGG